MEQMPWLSCGGQRTTSGTGSLCPPYTAWESDSGYKVRQQASLHVEPPHQFSLGFSESLGLSALFCHSLCAKAGLELLLSCLYLLRTVITGM